jgi:uncharacterized membrane protein
MMGDAVMNDKPVEFQKTAIGPVDCLKASKDVMGDQYWLFLGISFVGMLIASAVPLGILMGPMMCGIYLCYFRRMRGETVEFGTLFKGFDYFVQSLLATLILVGVMAVVMLPVYCLLFAGITGMASQVDRGRGDELALASMFGMMGVFYLIVLLMSLAVWVFAAFAYPLIVDRDLKAVPALTTSFRAAWANLGGMLGLVGLLFVISLAASLCCYVPVFFFMPFAFGTMAVAYRKVFPDQSKPAV